MSHHQLFKPIHIVLSVLIGVVLLFNAYQIAGINTLVAGPEKPELEATLITVDCEDCIGLNSIFGQLKTSKEFEVEANEISSTDTRAKRLMQEYDIMHLPVIIVEGDTDKVQLQGFAKNNDAFVMQAPAPYYDVKSASTVGLVSIQYVKADSCQNCTDLTLLGSQLTQFGVAIADETTFAASSSEGKQLIETYQLTKLPAAILSPDAGAYESLQQAWTQVGDIAPDGSYVVRVISPPYYDLASKSIKGKVNLISLYDSTCADCYNVSLHKTILQNFGMFIASETTLDINVPEGKQFVDQYTITAVPTIILTGEPSLYPALDQVWPSVGTVESDGAYVFRNVAQLEMKYVNVTS
ncbi:hypothetical protein HY492_00990 [Candidatus Woesearchaeota archaeon]|nr:hypothetical protein [Candidatus Woesearchaeota archaeon]